MNASRYRHQVDANHPLAGEDLYLDLEIVGLTKGSTLGSCAVDLHFDLEPVKYVYID